MNVDVVFLPRDLAPRHFIGRAVVVFDVLRATTTMTAALAAGVREIHIFGSVAEAAQAARDQGDTTPETRPLLCGEVRCLPPPGFDLGNSPGAFSPAEHAGRTLFMATTNGTRALVAARAAPLLLAGALVNASAVARRLLREGLDVTLLCAGTGGDIAMEDLLGTGAVLESLLLASATLESDAAQIALHLFRAYRSHLRETLAQTAGGRNVLAVGLDADLDFAARLDAIDALGVVRDNPLRVVRSEM